MVRPAMRFPDPLVRATLQRRDKRFLADVALADGAVATAHCANPGSMLGLAVPGAEIWLSPARDPKRKLRWNWELEKLPGGWAAINTGNPNRLAEEAIRDGRIAELAGYGALRREVKYGRNSRIDLLLEDASRPPAYVEVKNVHLMRRPGLAEFPDCVTVRGAKHLVELGDMAAAGHRAVMLYIVQMTGADRFAVAADLDPAYAAGLRTALSRGVEVLCYNCAISTEGIDVAGRLPFVPS
jgi:sugar fermentation stimulation protein A